MERLAEHPMVTNCGVNYPDHNATTPALPEVREVIAVSSRTCVPFPGESCLHRRESSTVAVTLICRHIQRMSSILVPPPASPRSPAQDPAAVVSMARFFSPRSIMDTDSLYSSAERLFALLEELRIPHVLVGGLALLFHAEARNTEDVDLIVALPDIQALPGLVIEDRNEWFAKAGFGPLRVDLLFTVNPLFAGVAAKHVETRTFHGHTLCVATAEGLLLLKLYALPSLYRQGQIARAALYESDIALLLLANPVEDEALLSGLRPHMSDSDIHALAEVLRDVRARMTRKF
jgi:hypothetical protein